MDFLLSSEDIFYCNEVIVFLVVIFLRYNNIML